MEFRNVDVSKYEKFGEGASSIVYVDPNVPNEVLKVFSEGVSFEEIEREFLKSVNVNLLGLPSPKAYELVKFDNKYAIRYERILNKVSISRAIVNDFDNIDKYIKIYADEARKLHSTKADITKFTSQKGFYNSLIDKLDFLTNEKRNKLREFLMNIPETGTVLHGDMHTGNIIIDDKLNPYWIDLGAVSYGNPLFDLGAYYFLMNIVCFAPFAQENFHMNPQQMQKCWKLFIGYYFNNFDEKFLEEKNKEIHPYSVFFPIFGYVVMGLKFPKDIDFINNIIDRL